MPVTLTLYGKEIRKLRVDADVKLKHMAEALDVSIAYLSALEIRATSKIGNIDFLHDVVQFFVDRTDHSRRSIEERLLRGLSDAQSTLKIDLQDRSVSDRLLALTFAYKLDSLSEADKARIASILDQ